MPKIRSFLIKSWVVLWEETELENEREEEMQNEFRRREERWRVGVEEEEENGMCFNESLDVKKWRDESEMFGSG